EAAFVWPACDRRPGCSAVALTDRSARRRLSHRRRVRDRRRRTRRVRDDALRLAPGRAAPPGSGRAAVRDRGLVATMVGTMQDRWTVARGRDALAYHALGVDLPSHRRDRRRADDLAAGENRRRA